MPALVDNESRLQPTSHFILILNRTNQTLAHHLTQENRKRIVVPEPRDLNRHLNPLSLPRDSSGAFLALAIQRIAMLRQTA
jgi:hypothetical protein